MILDYILRRLALLMFMMLTLSIFTFSLSFMFPGDALTNLSGITNSTFSQTSVLEEKFHFTDNYVVQYFAFLERIIQGDWGISFASGESVFQHIKDLFPATLELSLYALIVSVIVG
ncbi:MAG: ABC transporter permease, partial [Pseudomonadota bacterium]|nr:ABC transporter permease [Pseudomonadota bacterium]